MRRRRPALLLAAASLALLGATAPQSSDIEYQCQADENARGTSRAFPLDDAPYAVSGRVRVDRKADQSSAAFVASATAQIFSRDGRNGVYLILGGDSQFLGETVTATLVHIRDGRQRDQYEFGLFRVGVPLRFSLSLDENGRAEARLGTRTARLRADPLDRAIAVLSCALGSFTFSEVRLGQ